MASAGARLLSCHQYGPLRRPTVSFEAPGDESQFMKMTMHAVVSGYALGIEGWLDILAAVVLLLHILLALGHMLWVAGVRGGSSEAWDTMTELTASALTLVPPSGDVLAHTYAGTRKLGTLRLVSWVDVNAAHSAPAEQEQLQLRVGKKTARSAGGARLASAVYGRA
jgi:hypothetical protein